VCGVLWLKKRMAVAFSGMVVSSTVEDGSALLYHLRRRVMRMTVRLGFLMLLTTGAIPRRSLVLRFPAGPEVKIFEVDAGKIKKGLRVGCVCG